MSEELGDVESSTLPNFVRRKAVKYEDSPMDKKADAAGQRKMDKMEMAKKKVKAGRSMKSKR